MVRNLIISLIFIIGLSIFFYPIISNWLSTKDHYTAISKHNEALEKMTLAEKKAERKKAEQYNNTITETSIPIEDPFSSSNNTEQSKSYYDVLDIGETMGSIEIPRLQLKLPIYHGVSEEVLQRGIGHMSNSSFPIGGLNTHTALTGHRGLPSSKLFRNLDQMKVGDYFYIHILDEVLTYEVDDIKIVLPTETSWLEMVEDKDYVTLITCEPYMINTHRLLVRGERVEHIKKDHVENEVVETVHLDTTPTYVHSEDGNKTPYVLISLAIGFLFLLSLLFYKERRQKRG